MFADENVSKQITMKGFYVPAALSLMLLSLPIAAQSVATDTILLATFNDSISLDEVVIKAHRRRGLTVVGVICNLSIW